MHVRHGSHCREDSINLGKHFGQHGHGMNNTVKQIIDCNHKGREDAALKFLEGLWMHRLATFEVHGSINARDELTMNQH